MTHWVIAAAVAGQLAWVGAPLARVEVGAWWLHLPAAALLALGLARRSPLVLLVGVPLAWATAAFGLPHGAFSTQLAWVATAASLAYFVAALRWLRVAPEAQTVEWTATEAGASPGARDPLPWVGACLMGGPALGVLLWPAIPRAAAAGFPGHAGRVTVALALLATLIGLALATDLARGRVALEGDRGRARAFALVSVAALGMWAGVAR